MIAIATVSAALPAIVLSPSGGGGVPDRAPTAGPDRVASASPEAVVVPRRVELGGGERMAGDRKADIRMGAAVDPKASLQPYEVKPPFAVEDGLTFGPEGALRTRLAHLHGPGRDAVCLNAEGHLWACGLQARVALNNLLKTGPVICTPVRPADAVVVASCTVNAAELGRQLVVAGFARPAGVEQGLARSEQSLDVALAQAERRGLWNGGWRLK